MHLIDLYQKQDFVFSIEIFPPKTDPGMLKLKSILEAFKSCTPDYISVTYGAGGTSRENTHELAAHIHHELDVPAMAHLTCVAHTAEEIDSVLSKLKNSEITNVMALRGDPTVGTNHFIQPKGGYHFASELITAIREHSDFGIGAAGYPEGHLENPDKDDDRKHLHEKIAAGADFVVTQFFLDNTFFLRWRDKLRQEGANIPLVAGILPPANLNALERIAGICGVSVPEKLRESLSKYQHDQEASREIGLLHSERQIEGLLAEGVEGIHLYALNRLETVMRLGPGLKKSALTSVV
ncbi:MAG: methylenetetrahydrofolate reductase [SAR324 cluster bacterium]|nr:methylenetetrahydrofolate reductase [SAR324 cluster bacterium]MBL7034173.1 methylenetetrahydrofolate reductase [SAR324 cluster bacterium]